MASEGRKIRTLLDSSALTSTSSGMPPSSAEGSEAPKETATMSESSSVVLAPTATNL
eukprot:CAMPEP_0206438510 /NCGR_PEP_ID=MMETSP0324_2-20121206/11673_1 /ASSEMBLY_ACC=CAM_ASM_000836 /TAXON_ID=2866 /ORGANISM="Crypthecodinium cohnii, Strain Seligo" /LENGTH=56 /DNA_ID=CAMNT_0053905983 /DNA_START=109 /DNA_END=279 /DNA_ORIENTATION=+